MDEGHADRAVEDDVVEVAHLETHPKRYTLALGAVGVVAPVVIVAIDMADIMYDFAKGMRQFHLIIKLSIAL